MNYLKLGIVAIIAFLAGKYIFPPSPQIKEAVKYVEVEKKKEDKHKVVKSTTVKKPDGTKVTETTVTEDTQTATDTSIKLDSSKVTKAGKGITVGMLYLKDAENFGRPANFGATISVPVIGNLKAQALGTTDKRVGVGLALEF
jgi:hypothetical protein